MVKLWRRTQRKDHVGQTRRRYAEIHRRPANVCVFFGVVTSTTKGVTLRL